MRPRFQLYSMKRRDRGLIGDPMVDVVLPCPGRGSRNQGLALAFFGYLLQSPLISDGRASGRRQTASGPVAGFTDVFCEDSAGRRGCPRPGWSPAHPTG